MGEIVKEKQPLNSNGFVPSMFIFAVTPVDGIINLWKSQHSYLGECHERSVN